jgi:CRP/FNR family transcriptional regulator
VKYPVTAMTLEDTKVCFIPKTTFLELLTANSDFAALLLKDACHELNHFTEDITNIAQKPVKERVAATLISLNELFKDGEEVTTINMTREDLANMVGTATETLIRLLQDFKKEGLITSKGRKITIEEPEKLLRIANL